MKQFRIEKARLDDARVRDLLLYHHQQMIAGSPPGQAFVLDLGAFDANDIELHAAWSGEMLAAVGALKFIGRDHAELKSMRTSPSFLRRGAATAMLMHLLEIARSRAVRRVSLETGTGPAFEPAIALYLRNGFEPGPAFADYQASDFNQFFHLGME